MLKRSLSFRFESTLKKCKQLSSVCGATAPYGAEHADKLVYNHAIEMCQSAALSELFGNQTDCFRHYQTAQILLHALSQQAALPHDRALLRKYTSMVERRLLLLHQKGLVEAHQTPVPQ